MSRRQEVCRDFQRGNCRFGTRCKFSHQLPQNQQPQSNAFDSGRRHSPQQQGGFGERGRNSFEALSNANSSQKPQQQVPLKDHKCNDPRVCKEQIKDDMAHEHPLFWRLTSYGHWKFLPNDISGDVSPEELRALAYDSAKQGLSLHQIAQKEASMVAAKNAEFESLLRNPYQSPVAQRAGFTPVAFPSSPFASTPQPGGNMVFGVPSTPSVGFGQPISPFGVAAGASPQSIGGFGSSFNTKGPVVPAPNTSTFLGNAYPQPDQNVFGTQLPPSQNFVGMQSFNGFGNTNSGIAGGFGIGGIGSAAPVPISPFNSPVPNMAPTLGFGNITQSPPPLGASLSTSTTPLPASPFTSQVLPGTSPFTKSSLEGQPPVADDIWLKETWKLGEIPEQEPPSYVRY
ncbi:unnamed protein product [Sphagnum troendelagicum]